ncbi:peptide methionine sulfoxide reductase MsrA-like [Hippocampus zosterae]|uniref:peptide methionine sulfoxide reductase MsrA-like n=1 Tax=Hippocampus zosterae TaxID=109293 RepID=UPI00223E08A3|nr:peptide methionine sulfoxide reductase MsrA-like [Hippocampus zosterae]
MGGTSHTEVVQVVYVPTLISAKDLITIFFAIHSPTHGGSKLQYQSVLYYSGEDQLSAFKEVSKAHEEKTGLKVVTRTSKEMEFYQAEDKHVNFYNKNGPSDYSCKSITNKINGLKKELPGLF